LGEDPDAFSHESERARQRAGIFGSLIIFSTMSDEPFDYTEHPHRRYNPLSGKWVLVSPHRAKRPWQGATEGLPSDDRPENDPKDFLGPGNVRVSGGVTNPEYDTTFVFDNDFQALLSDTPEGEIGSVEANDLLVAKSWKGRCRVVCFHPKLNRTVAEMTVEDLYPVVETWVDEFKMLSSLPYVNHVQIFENKGAMMGCSNPHPHGQIWSSEFIPDEPAAELANLAKYHAAKGTHMLEDYAALEMKQKKRIVCQNDTFLAVVPFWAVWPFEVLVFTKKRIPSIINLDDKMQKDLADIYRRVACRYDNLFTTLFPYSMGIHQAPCNLGAEGASAHEHAHLHLHFYPPLLRSATVRKYMVGFELLGEAQRDLTAEQAAARLEACSEEHYSHTRKADVAKEN
jgi:UDPglucose--hexose-1-phosphate uridylyltransferase